MLAKKCPDVSMPENLSASRDAMTAGSWRTGCLVHARYKQICTRESVSMFSANKNVSS